jgi:predicted PurR-regulated permease PerM/uncharacterized tellurite resistance protein B-like protein
MKLPDIFSSVFSRTGHLFEKPAARAVSAVSGILNPRNRTDKAADSKIAEAVFSLIRAVARADGDIDSKEKAELESFLAEKFPPERVQNFRAVFNGDSETDIEGATQTLRPLSGEERTTVISALVNMAMVNDECAPEQREMIKSINSRLALPEDIPYQLEKQYIEYRDKGDSFFKSGAGLLFALIIILVFVLTATFLKSVLFGLIMAYFFLPLEKRFEKFISDNRFAKASISFFSTVLGPVLSVPAKIKEFFTRKELEPQQPADEAERHRISIVNKACAATIFSVVALFSILCIFIIWLSLSYVSDIKTSVRSWASGSGKDKREASRDETTALEKARKKSFPDKQAETVATYIDSAIYKLEGYKPEIEKIPLFKWAVDKVRTYLNDSKNREKLTALILRKSGGVFSYTAGILGNILSIILNTLLAFFFFSLFLQKIAYISSAPKSTGGSIVNEIMDSKWMPHTSFKTRSEATEIINNIIIKLKAWVRGYFSIIFIESIVYITAFSFLKIPYAPVLGFLAGCTVLLPYVGPLSSALLTLVVYFAIGAPSMLTATLIVLLYIIMNGVIEQLFLYPSFVGNALGLTTVETIIVVLLGGLFAGFSGMIFAVPAASVLKYLIPEIYSCWKQEEQAI